MTKCNCAQYPFTPHVPCYKICTGKVLNYASPDELLHIFLVPQGIAEKIAAVNLENKAVTLDDYQQYLTAAEFTLLNRLFSQLENNPAALNWLRRETGSNLQVDERVPVEV